MRKNRKNTETTNKATTNTAPDYFGECRSIDDVKRIFRQHAHRLHPDNGGNAADFAELRRQYEEAISREYDEAADAAEAAEEAAAEEAAAGQKTTGAAAAGQDPSQDDAPSRPDQDGQHAETIGRAPEHSTAGDIVRDMESGDSSRAKWIYDRASGYVQKIINRGGHVFHASETDPEKIEDKQKTDCSYSPYYRYRKGSDEHEDAVNAVAFQMYERAKAADPMTPISKLMYTVNARGRYTSITRKVLSGLLKEDAPRHQYGTGKERFDVYTSPAGIDAEEITAEAMDTSTDAADFHTATDVKAIRKISEEEARAGIFNNPQLQRIYDSALTKRTRVYWNYIINGLSWNEIADRTGKKENAARMAMGRLARWKKNAGQDPEDATAENTAAAAAEEPAEAVDTWAAFTDWVEYAAVTRKNSAPKNAARVMRLYDEMQTYNVNLAAAAAIRARIAQQSAAATHTLEEASRDALKKAQKARKPHATAREKLEAQSAAAAAVTARRTHAEQKRKARKAMITAAQLRARAHIAPATEPEDRTR